MSGRLIGNLEEELKKLPGIGNRSAQRLAYHLVKNGRGTMLNLATALEEAAKGLVVCQRCHDFADISPCENCSDPRGDNSLLCVVESSLDVRNIISSGEYNGRYFVLGGLLSPIEGNGPEQIGVNALCERVNDGLVKEVIFALNPSPQGESTMHYLYEELKHLPLTFSRLSTGLPFGGEVSYTAPVTLAAALKGRRSY